MTHLKWTVHPKIFTHPLCHSNIAFLHHYHCVDKHTMMKHSLKYIFLCSAEKSSSYRITLEILISLKYNPTQTQVLTSLSLRRHAHRPLAERLMHMAHLAGNTSGVSKSSSDWVNYLGFFLGFLYRIFRVL